jgi:hypothetical protein
VWEEELRVNMEIMLNQIHLSSTDDDEWKCHHAIGGMVTVNSMYTFLSDLISLPPFASNVEKLSHLEQLWISYAPSKVLV